MSMADRGPNLLHQTWRACSQLKNPALVQKRCLHFPIHSRAACLTSARKILEESLRFDTSVSVGISADIQYQAVLQLYHAASVPVHAGTVVGSDPAAELFHRFTGLICGLL